MSLSTKPWIEAMLAAIVLVAPRLPVAQQPVHEIQIVAGKFQFEPATIQVTAGEPVRLVIRSKDGAHGFAIPAMKIDERIPGGGKPVTVEFIAPDQGEYDIACSEFCGSGHGHMRAALVSSAAHTGKNRLGADNHE
jgi:heme/copper-type cytochrome/quinol oxidase subunit 2